MKRLKFLILFLFTTSAIFAQQPNDCVNAITICGNGTFSSNASGIGTIQEVAGCSGFEHNSIWIKINIVNGGTLGFNLIPTNPALVVDYDFWVYGANRPCNNLGSPIRCCTTNPLLAGLSSNVTGMLGTTVATTGGPGANGNGFVRWLNVSPGESYYIAIDRPVGDGGFQLQWIGTAMDTGGAFDVPPTANSLGEVRSCSVTPNVGIFDLNSLRGQINPDLVNNTISFHTNIADATDAASPLPNIYGNTSNPQTIYARVKNNFSGCFTITSFQLKVYQVPTATVSSTTPTICANTNGTVVFNGTPNAIIEYNINSGATQTATLNNSGVFEITTPLSVTTTYKLIQVKIVDTSNLTLCSQTLNSTVTITVSSPPVPTISNVGNICSDGVQTLTFNGLANASINYTINGGTNQTVVLDNSGQQQVNLSGLTPGNYTVLITSITEPNPPNCTTFVNITSVFTVQDVLFADIAVSNSVVCSGTSVVVTFTGTPNVNVTYTVNSGSNQTIALNNSGTASITTPILTTNQTYQLVNAFTLTPNCTKLESDSVTIAIIAQPSVTSFTGTTSICFGSSTDLSFIGTPNAIVTYFDGTVNQTVQLDGVGNATVSVSPTVLTTYSLVSVVIASTPVCSNSASGNVIVTVNNAPQAGTDGSTTVCESSTTAIDLFSLITGEQAGGTWTRTGSGTGGTFNAAAGTFTPAVGATTSTFMYTLTGTFPCIDDSSLVTVNINSQPIAGVDGVTTVCETSTSSIDLFSLITGEQAGGVWTRTGIGTGGVFNAAAGTFIPTIGATTSTFTYTLSGNQSCIDDSSVATVNINAQPNAGTDATTTVCASSTAVIDLYSLITGEQTGGIWTRTGGSGGIFDAVAGTFTPAAGATNSAFTYTLTGTFPCVNDASVATVNFSAQPNAGTDGGTAICDNSTTTIDLFSLITGEQVGGNWTRTTGIGGIFDPVLGTFTPAVGANTSSFTYTLTATTPCVSDVSLATVTINPIPTNISISGGLTTCAGIPVNLEVTATPGTVITWSGTPSSFTIGSTGMNVIPVSPTATTTYTLTSASLNGCTIPVLGQSTTVTVSPTPQFITQVPDITICNGGTLNIASQLTSTVPGTTFVWSATSSNVNTAAISGNQGNIDQIVNLINSLQEGSFNIEVTPQVGTCSGTSQQILVNVKTIPVIPVNNGVSADRTVICNNESVTITLNSSPAATLYNWQVNAANTNGVQIVGGATSGTSTNGVITLQLSLTNPLAWGEISFNFTPENATCPGDMVVNAIKIRVNPIPGTPIGLPVSEICSGESTNLTISSFPIVTGTDLVWTVIDSQNVTGFTNGTGPSPFVINDLLINTSNVQGFVKYSVTSKLGNCNGGTTEYIVEVNPLPKPNLINGHICVNEDTGITYQGYVLDAQLSDPDFTYDWYILNPTTNTFEALLSGNQSTYEATVAGTYQLIVTNTVTNCAAPAVQATVGTIYPAQAFTSVVTDAFTNDATITVTVNPVGTGNLIYSLDGGAWQSSNVFTGVEAGLHQVMVEDVEGCTNLTQSVMVIDYPKFFTPNGDGYNDNWKIVGLNQADAKLYIFDRYGKLIKQLSATDKSSGWDGTYNGQQAPSSDYWFSLEYIENNQQKQFKSHFSLKR